MDRIVGRLCPLAWADRRILCRAVADGRGRNPVRVVRRVSRPGMPSAPLAGATRHCSSADRRFQDIKQKPFPQLDHDRRDSKPSKAERRTAGDVKARDLMQPKGRSNQLDPGACPLPCQLPRSQFLGKLNLVKCFPHFGSRGGGIPPVVGDDYEDGHPNPGNCHRQKNFRKQPELALAWTAACEDAHSRTLPLPS